LVKNNYSSAAYNKNFDNIQTNNYGHSSELMKEFEKDKELIYAKFNLNKYDNPKQEQSAKFSNLDLDPKNTREVKKKIINYEKIDNYMINQNTSSKNQYASKM
jgi:hypothetical protein